MTQTAYIYDALRTPRGKGKKDGALHQASPIWLTRTLLKEMQQRHHLDTSLVDDIVLGCVTPVGEQGSDIARIAALDAGWDQRVAGVTLSRYCASGLESINLAAAKVMSGMEDMVVAGGVESMSRAPWVMEKPTTGFAKPGATFDTSIGWRFVNPEFAKREKFTYSMPETAEEVARVDGISREDCDAFAVRSHERAIAAIEAGHFKDEIVPVPVRDRKGNVTLVDTDEGPRPGTTTEVLAKLRPVVAGGEVVTAGNSSTLNDGASAIIVASEAAIEKYALTPRARFVTGAAAGLAPEIMGLGPVPATEKVLARAGWSIEDLGAVELNEAFASQSLGSMRRLGLCEDIVNRDGGAISLGHPLGSSGSRLIITLLGRMEREDAERGLATMCIGVGQGAAVLVEKV